MKVCGVGFACCESCRPMLEFCPKKKKAPRFSQVMGVCLVFVGLVTQLCGPSSVCVCVEPWTYMYIDNINRYILSMVNT